MVVFPTERQDGLASQTLARPGKHLTRVLTRKCSPHPQGKPLGRKDSLAARRALFHSIGGILPIVAILLLVGVMAGCAGLTVSKWRQRLRILAERPLTSRN